jgi:hypothetical protein
MRGPEKTESLIFQRLFFWFAVGGLPHTTVHRRTATTDPALDAVSPYLPRFRRKHIAVARLTPPTGYARLPGAAMCAKPACVVLANTSLMAAKVTGRRLCPSGESVVYLRHGKSSPECHTAWYACWRSVRNWAVTGEALGMYQGAMPTMDGGGVQ